MLDIYVTTIASANWLFVGLMFLGGLVISHLVGSSFASALEVKPGHGRDVMPSLPVAPTMKGGEAIRFHQSVLRVERLLLRRFEGGVANAEASALAGELAEDPIVIEAALERLREEIPCQMKITASGRILHDFAADDIATLRGKRRAWLPVRLGVFGLAGLANIGAIWPVLLILTLALWTLDVAVSNAAQMAVQLGGVGLVVIAISFVVAMVVSWLMHFVLTPLTDAPKLGDLAEDAEEALPTRRTSGSDSSFWVWFGSSNSSSRRSSGGGGGGRKSNDGGGAAVGQAIIIIIAIAIIVLCTIALYVWLRGLWRALSRDERELERISPAFWVRTAAAIDKFERYIPTNDLVGRVYRALARAHSHRRPVDEDLGPRVLLLAAHRNGRVSAIDIALAEGLDLGEATEVGSRLCSLVEGRILVSDRGDLVFEFPPAVLSEIDATPDEDMWAEFLDPDGQIDRIRRRSRHSDDRVPVNLVGLTYSHLVATDRLVGGTWLMAVSGMIMLSYPGLLSFQLFAPLTTLLTFLAGAALPITLLLFAFAIGATTLSAAARYTARAVAIHGVARDIRRATFDVVRQALDKKISRVDLTPLSHKLYDVFRPAWRDISPTFIDKEIHGVLVDLDLSPALDAEGRLEVSIVDLRERRDTALSTAQSIDDGVVLDFEADDPVVFETALTHDRVKVLA